VRKQQNPKYERLAKNFKRKNVGTTKWARRTSIGKVRYSTTLELFQNVSKSKGVKTFIIPKIIKRTI